MLLILALIAIICIPFILSKNQNEKIAADKENRINDLKEKIAEYKTKGLDTSALEELLIEYQDSAINNEYVEKEEILKEPVEQIDEGKTGKIIAAFLVVIVIMVIAYACINYG